MPGQEVKFHFIKSPDCREILVDGAFGGPAPSGRIVMAVYSERQPIPQETVHELSEGGELGPELLEKRAGKQDFIRTVNAVLHLDVRTARVIRDWLARKIDEIEAAKSKPNS